MQIKHAYGHISNEPPNEILFVIFTWFTLTKLS